jgi:hypothetical protein
MCLHLVSKGEGVAESGGGDWLPGHEAPCSYTSVTSPEFIASSITFVPFSAVKLYRPILKDSYADFAISFTPVLVRGTLSWEKSTHCPGDGEECSVELIEALRLVELGAEHASLI